MPHYPVDNDLNKAQSIYNDFDWLVMNYFYEPVDNNKDWIIAIVFLISQNW